MIRRFVSWFVGTTLVYLSSPAIEAAPFQTLRITCLLIKMAQALHLVTSVWPTRQLHSHRSIAVTPFNCCFSHLAPTTHGVNDEACILWHVSDQGADLCRTFWCSRGTHNSVSTAAATNTSSVCHRLHGTGTPTHVSGSTKGNVLSGNLLAHSIFLYLQALV